MENVEWRYVCACIQLYHDNIVIQNRFSRIAFLCVHIYLCVTCVFVFVTHGMLTKLSLRIRNRYLQIRGATGARALAR